MNAFVAAGGGFLLAVLWFDLMFDVQARNPTEAAVESISTYYRRVTTRARPMNQLVAIVMFATLAAIVVQIVSDDPSWLGWVALALAAPPIALAGARTVPNAVRLGAASDPADVRAKLARSILRDHVLCFASIAALVILQLTV